MILKFANKHGIDGGLSGIRLIKGLIVFFASDLYGRIFTFGIAGRKVIDYYSNSDF